MKCLDCTYDRFTLVEVGTYVDETPVNAEGRVLSDARTQVSAERIRYFVRCIRCRREYAAVVLMGHVHMHAAELAALATARGGAGEGASDV